MTFPTVPQEIRTFLTSHQKPRVTEHLASRISHRIEQGGASMTDGLAVAALTMGADAIDPLLRGRQDRMLVRALGLRRSYEIDPNAQRRFDVMFARSHLPFGANREVIAEEMKNQLSALGESRPEPENTKSLFRVELGEGFVGHVDAGNARFFVRAHGEWYGSFALDGQRDGALVSSSAIGAIGGKELAELGLHLKANAEVRHAELKKNALRIGQAEIREIHRAIHGARPHPRAPYREATPSDLVRMLAADFAHADHQAAAGEAATALLTKLRKQYGKEIKIFVSNRLDAARDLEAKYGAPGSAVHDPDLNSADVLFVAGRAGKAISLALSDPRVAFENGPRRLSKGPVSFEANLFGGTIGGGWTNVFASRYREGRSLDEPLLETLHRANHGSGPAVRYRATDVGQIAAELVSRGHLHASPEMMRGALERAIQHLSRMHGGEAPKIFSSMTPEGNVHLAIGFEASRALYELYVEPEKIYPKTSAEKLLESAPEMSVRLDRIFEKLKAVPTATPREPIGQFEECTLVRAIDADTIDVVNNQTGERKRVRYLAVDTEESYDTTYKTSTPLGVETKRWAKANLEVGMPIRIEFDDTAGREEVFGRGLGYVWFKSNDEWKNMNFELVARGLSTFSTKYGFPGQREDAPYAKILAELQASSREKELGIWDREATPPLCNAGTAEKVERDLARARSLQKWVNQVEAARPDIFAPRRPGDFAKIREQDGKAVELFTAWFVPSDRTAYFAALDERSMPAEPAVFQIEGGGQNEVWKLMVQPSPEFHRTVRALLDQKGHYRYLSGTVKKDDAGIAIVIDSPEALRADPTPATR